MNACTSKWFLHLFVFNSEILIEYQQTSNYTTFIFLAKLFILYQCLKDFDSYIHENKEYTKCWALQKKNAEVKSVKKFVIV